MTSRSKNLCEQAVADLVKYTERFEQEGLTGIWYAILDVTTTLVSDTIKRRKNATYKKGSENKGSNEKVLRKRQRRGGVLCNRKQRQNKRR